MMRLKLSPKSLKLSILSCGSFILLAACATIISTSDIERLCRAQTEDFAKYARCISHTYNNLPTEQRSSYEDLDRYFIDQAALLAKQVESGEISAVEAEAALSRARMEAESQRRERNYYYDRARFDVGVGFGHPHGYWGRYGY